MSLIKLLPEQQLLEIIHGLQNNLDDKTTNTLNTIFKELIEANIHLEVVKLLLANDKVDPSADNNRAIRFTSQNGHLEIVKLLLANDKVDPSADNNYAIRLASLNGHSEIVKLLLANDKVDPSADNNYAIAWASRNGHLEVVKLLIPRVDMSKITDTKILDIAKEMTKVEETIKVEEIIKTESLEESIRLILVQMRSHNMYKIHIKKGEIRYSCKS